MLAENTAWISTTGVRQWSPSEKADVIASMRRLVQLGASTSENAEAKIRALDELDPEYVTEVINSLLSEYLGLSKQFELKVPVAVPRGAITTIRAN